ADPRPAWPAFQPASECYQRRSRPGDSAWPSHPLSCSCEVTTTRSVRCKTCERIWLLKTQTLSSEGGEALPIDTRCWPAMNRHDELEQSAAPRWFVVWTASHCERLAHEQLSAARFETFLPMMRAWSRQRGVRRTIAVPMFAGYV